MRITSSSIVSIVTILLSFRIVVEGLGSASTIAIVYDTKTVCGIIAGEPTQRIECYQNGQVKTIEPNISYEAISGGKDFFCGLISGGSSILCWDTNQGETSFQPKRIYYNDTVRLTDLSVGETHVCAREIGTGIAECWRGIDSNGDVFPAPRVDLRFLTITSGNGFSCGILRNHSVFCWGYSENGREIQRQFANLSMSSLVAGESHCCGLTKTGILVCKGNDDFAQSVPSNSSFTYSGLALGGSFTCAIRKINGLVVCWGEDVRSFEHNNNEVETVSFENIVSGLDFTCGLTRRNLSIVCWGKGWPNGIDLQTDLPLGTLLPGPCVQSSCTMCGIYSNSKALCHGLGNICNICQVELPTAFPIPPEKPTPSGNPQERRGSHGTRKHWLVYLIVGVVGTCFGIFSLVCWFLSRNYVANIVRPILAENESNYILPSGPSTIGQPSSRTENFSNQLSESSSRYADENKTRRFFLSELAVATSNFSPGNKIGSGSFGIVYKGKLMDGSYVAIKRGDTSTKTKKLQDKESAFDSELGLLLRLHHKHLVSLVGFCQEKDERLLVYEYMGNGSLHDHLHNKKFNETSTLNSWKMRIKFGLDAARGIDYLHSYAVPSIVHRDIKSSNILIDDNWTARVSDFGLSLIGPKSDQEYMSTRAVGTVGYIDPEYYVTNILTTKSDVYGFGVVLLELLTGKKALFKNAEEGSSPMGLVEYAVPLILGGELQTVLDRRIDLQEINVAEAVEMVAYLATHCVNLEGKQRPTMSEIVGILERALLLCDNGRESYSLSSSFRMIASS